MNSNLKEQIENLKKRLHKRESVSKRNRELILKFIERQTSTGEVKERRVLKYLNELPNWAEWLGKDFDKVTQDDLTRALSILESKGYKDWTKFSYKVVLKTFYGFLTDGEPPKFIKNIRARRNRNGIKKASDMLTVNEVKKLIRSCDNERDQCAVAMLWDLGCRIGELVNLRISDIVFKENLCKVSIYAQKTGESRTVPATESVPYIVKWLEKHPTAHDKDSHLFVITAVCGKYEEIGKQISYRAISDMLSKVKIKSGITKPCNPHAFRHSRASYMASRLPEPLMRKFFGWSASSEMPATYVHLSGHDIETAILKIHGKGEIEPPKESLESKTCERCAYSNPPHAELCHRCGLILDKKEQMEFEKQSGYVAQAMQNMREQLVKETIDILRKEGVIKEKGVSENGRIQ